LLLPLEGGLGAGGVPHYFPITKALVSVPDEAFPFVLEERELGVQMALDEDPFATIDLRSR
jgi:hypothetical protein